MSSEPTRFRSCFSRSHAPRGPGSVGVVPPPMVAPVNALRRPRDWRFWRRLPPAHLSCRGQFNAWSAATTMRPTASDIGGQTAFPTCRYRATFGPCHGWSSGNAWRMAHSSTVRRRRVACGWSATYIHESWPFGPLAAAGAVGDGADMMRIACSYLSPVLPACPSIVGAGRSVISLGGVRFGSTTRK